RTRTASLEGWSSAIELPPPVLTRTEEIAPTPPQRRHRSGYSGEHLHLLYLTTPSGVKSLRTASPA
ncbi:MAG: hypothetical protein RMM08_08205, partial [Armatimonadota bacterium]|nr:hypothetical protein [Armatimonadota bacterium]